MITTNRIIGFLATLMISGTLAACSMPGGQGAATPTALPVIAEDTQVVAEARVVPAQYASLSLENGGLVQEVLAREGDQVQAGQVIVRLNDAQQQARVAQAEAQLRRAQASLERVKEGAREEDILAAEAQLRQAEAQLQQVLSSVTEADITAARAQVAQAQAQLARLNAGPKSASVRQAEAQLQQAQTSLEQQRDQLSSGKTQSALQLEQAAQALIQAQTNYSMAKWNWEHVERYGTDPVTPTSPDPQNPANEKKNKLNDVQKQQYKDALIRAEAALRSAEDAVRQAQIAYDNARQAELRGLQQAEQQIIAAQAGLEQVQSSIEPDQIIAARAQLANARASLERLTGKNREDQINSAKAGVDAAVANLARVKLGPRASEINEAEAQVAIAQADLDAARIALEQLELRTPFNGTLTTLDVRIGEYVQGGTVVARIADTSSWVIETSDLTELNIVRVRTGAPVQLTFDAIPDLTLDGSVTRIQSFGENRQGDITYLVTITPTTLDPRLRWNMTVSAAITIE